jgi:hypothetical protein
MDKPSKAERRFVWFGATFWFCAAAVGAYFLGVRPVQRYRAAKSWPSVPCEIVSSGLEPYRGESGRSDKLDISYRYDYAGQTFTSDAYDLFSGQSTGCREEKTIVAALQPGSWVTCYVNPSNPREAVLDRRLPPEIGSVLLPLVVAALTAVGLVRMRRRARAGSAPGQFSSLAVSGDGALAAPGPVAPSVFLPRHGSRWSAPALSAALHAGLWWFVSGRLDRLLSAHWKPAGLPPSAHAAVYIVLGFLLAWRPIRMFLELFNPELELRLSPAVARPGQAARLEWRVRGRGAPISSLRISLDGWSGQSDRPRYNQLLFEQVVGVVPPTGQLALGFPAAGQRPWPPNDREMWWVRVELQASPLPKATTGYRLPIAG